MYESDTTSGGGDQRKTALFVLGRKPLTFSVGCTSSLKHFESHGVWILWGLGKIPDTVVHNASALPEV